MLSAWCVRDCKKVIYLWKLLSSLSLIYMYTSKIEFYLWSDADNVFFFSFAIFAAIPSYIPKKHQRTHSIYRRKVQSRIETRLFHQSPNKTVKCLGKFFDSLRDRQNVSDTSNPLESWMDTKEKSASKPRKYKRGYRIYLSQGPRHLLVRTTSHWHQFNRWNDGICGYLRRWIAVPRSYSSIGLYRRGAELQLPVTSIVDEFKITRVRQF